MPKLETGGVFSVHYDQLFYQSMLERVGQDQAVRIAATRFSNNFRYLAWEGSGMLLPETGRYEVIEQGEQILVCHESDKDSGFLLDIVEATSEQERSGLVKKGVENYRQALIDSPVGSSVIFINPKAEEGEDCTYTKTHMYIADISEESDSHDEKVKRKIEYREFQFDLDTKKCQELLTRLNPEISKVENPTLAEIITQITIINAHFSTDQIVSAIKELMGVEHNPSEYEQAVKLQDYIRRCAPVAGLEYRYAVMSGTPKEVLSKLHAQLLGDVLNVNSEGRREDRVLFSSCGNILITSSSTNNEKIIRAGWWCASCNAYNPCESTCHSCSRKLSVYVKSF